MWAKYIEFHPGTVHGFQSFFRHPHCGGRTLLLTVWLALCIGVCLYEFTTTFQSYLSFSIKTTKELVEAGAEGIEFPAITFCSASVGRRSAMGVTPYVRTTWTLVATRITDQTELNQLSQMCVKNATAAEVIGKTNQNDCVNIMAPKLNECFAIEVSDNLQAFQSETGVGALGIPGFKQTQVDSLRSAVNCKWNSNDINCSQIFINKFTDAGFCFTFNPALDLLKTYDLAGTNAVKTGREWSLKSYGMTTLDWKLYVSKNTGSKSGFSVILLSNTTEYCIAAANYGGFVATVHDPMSEPLTITKNGINLSPGWQTNVAMSLTKTDRRQTEYRGYCKSQLDLLTYKNVVDYTSRDYFIIDCVVKKVITECQCSPYYSPRGIVYLYKDFPNVFQVNRSKLDFFDMCGYTFINAAAQVSCQNLVEQKVLKSGECLLPAPKPCEETQISTKSTSSRWPDPAVLPMLKRHINGTADMSLAEFQQNFLSANFFFDEYRYNLVTESLKMTWVDLMNQLGGAMGMTLGLSIIGVVELLIWILTRPIVILIKYYSNNSQNEHLYKIPDYSP